jgi:hypothetical protein
MTEPFNLEALPDDVCAICGKGLRQHSKSSGFGVCSIYPVFVSERQMFARLALLAETRKAKSDE